MFQHNIGMPHATPKRRAPEALKHPLWHPSACQVDVPTEAPVDTPTVAPVKAREQRLSLS